MILGIENRTENWKTARTFGRMYSRECCLPWLTGYLKSYCEFAIVTCQISSLRGPNLELFWSGYTRSLCYPMGQEKGVEQHARY